MRTYGKTLREQNKDLYNRYYEEAMSQPVFPYTGDFEHEYALLEQVKNLRFINQFLLKQSITFIT